MDGRKFVNFKIIATSDVHGCFFPYDMIEQKEMLGSLARVSSFVKEQRQNPDVRRVHISALFILLKILEFLANLSMDLKFGNFEKVFHSIIVYIDRLQLEDQL